jgi:hypothetical protein
MYHCNECGVPIPSYRKSTLYCSDQCAYSAKLKREQERAAFNRNKIILLENELKLKEAYQKYGKTPFSAQVLLDVNFNWAIHTATQDVDGLPVRVMMSFGYTLFDNQKVQVCKF